MRILAIVADITPEKLGGAEHHFVEVLKRLAPKIEKVTLLVGPSNSIRKILPDLPQIEIKTVNYPHVTNLYGLFYIIFSLPIAVKLLLTNKYDLIWSKQEYPQGVIAGILRRLFPKVKLYLTSQSARLHKDELVVKGFLNQFQRFLTDLIDPLIRFALSSPDLVGAVSRFSANQAKLMGAKKCVIISNGVDLEKFKSQNSKVKITNKKFKIITTSSLIPRNGIDTLIKACSLLTFNFELVIAGDGPQEPMLKKLAQGLPVKFLGRVDNTKIPKLLQANNLFIRPSRAEGFGNSFVEAMAAGLPTVGTPVGGITDFLFDKKTGFLVPPDDPNALVKTIEFIYKNPKLAVKVASTGQKLVREKYSWDKIADQVYKQFKLLCP